MKRTIQAFKQREWNICIHVTINAQHDVQSSSIDIGTKTWLPKNQTCLGKISAAKKTQKKSKWNINVLLNCFVKCLVDIYSV